MFVALLVLAPACRRGASDTSAIPFAREPTGSTFEAIDQSGDGEIGFAAFHRGLSEHYYFRQGLDLDGDGSMEDAELTTAFFELWDTDDDGRLTIAEANAGIGVWFPTAIEGLEIRDWDVDEDGALDVFEMGEGTLRSRLYDPYDINGDSAIETSEASTYLFTSWDLNRDGLIDRTEWRLP